jgi:hypothetical protein
MGYVVLAVRLVKGWEHWARVQLQCDMLPHTVPPHQGSGGVCQHVTCWSIHVGLVVSAGYLAPLPAFVDAIWCLFLSRRRADVQTRTRDNGDVIPVPGSSFPDAPKTARVSAMVNTLECPLPTTATAVLQLSPRSLTRYLHIVDSEYHLPPTDRMSGGVMPLINNLSAVLDSAATMLSITDTAAAIEVGDEQVEPVSAGVLPGVGAVPAGAARVGGANATAGSGSDSGSGDGSEERDPDDDNNGRRDSRKRRRRARFGNPSGAAASGTPAGSRAHPAVALASNDDDDGVGGGGYSQAVKLEAAAVLEAGQERAVEVTGSTTAQATLRDGWTRVLLPLSRSQRLAAVVRPRTLDALLQHCASFATLKLKVLCNVVETCESVLRCAASSS